LEGILRFLKDIFLLKKFTSLPGEGSNSSFLLDRSLFLGDFFPESMSILIAGTSLVSPLSSGLSAAIGSPKLNLPFPSKISCLVSGLEVEGF